MVTFNDNYCVKVTKFWPKLPLGNGLPQARKAWVFLRQMTYYQDFFKIVIRDDLGNE